MAEASGPTAEKSPPKPGDFTVHAYGPIARGASVGLRLVALLNVLYLAASIVLDIVTGAHGAPPLQVALGLATFSGGPFVLALLLDQAVKGRIRVEVEVEVEVEAKKLVLTLRRERFEVPFASIESIRPLRLPLPGPGIRVVLASKRSFERRLVLADPAELLTALAEAIPSARGALTHPATRFAAARSALGRRRWPYYAVKYGLITLIFAVILFRLNQYIMYGGAFGQYHLSGLGAYLRSFLLRWTGIACGLVVYAGLVRSCVEALALGATYLFSARASGIRRAAEIVADVAYFVVIPGYVLAMLFG